MSTRRWMMASLVMFSLAFSLGAVSRTRLQACDDGDCQAITPNGLQVGNRGQDSCPGYRNCWHVTCEEHLYDSGGQIVQSCLSIQPYSDGQYCHLLDIDNLTCNCQGTIY